MPNSYIKIVCSISDALKGFNQGVLCMHVSLLFIKIASTEMVIYPVSPVQKVQQIFQASQSIVLTVL